MAYSITATKEILGVVLCCHCGEQVKVYEGSYHRNEEDQYYCECEGALKEKEIRNKQSNLRHEVHKLDYEAQKLINLGEDTLNQKMYEIEINNIKRKYKIN
ncbi:hypothetical protein COJ01_17680 [Priestia megaterium]|uniref:hypothetical protein n=1 Tax=Priestia megaterium TaxID=1404 RepID=UPI000BF3E575|nr:hypothetical protein [Priestia megaterium]PFK99893.1 hypothetical protein COJ01_17680 [Priestia megaterium]